MKGIWEWLTNSKWKVGLALAAITIVVVWATGVSGFVGFAWGIMLVISAHRILHGSWPWQGLG